MKLTKVAIFFFLFFSAQVVTASTSTNAVRTNSGQIVAVGDTYISMINKFQDAPLSTRSYEVEKNSLRYTVTEFYYLVNNIYYTITVEKNTIKAISWDKKLEP
ncbi:MULTISPECIES: hypothetical protein [Acinetobacter]|uniref:DUF2845 domain-containing protein n=1 Tax=Acinetobacter indicus TaxID=756892 RepID=A0A6C0Y7A2_9GAMM|nr:MULTISPECIES: hypothetical protein [Acinetobacter]QIC71752.1 hypothetical protein FSC09_15275 [Acinetobacter indicus]QKQ71660.1 hypothetical protein E5Y90_15635 [Acinetobacter sp. 10FS3-1]